MFCGKCSKSGAEPVHGAVTGAIPEKKWKAFGITLDEVKKLKDLSEKGELKPGGARSSVRSVPRAISETGMPLGSVAPVVEQEAGASSAATN